MRWAFLFAGRKMQQKFEEAQQQQQQAQQNRSSKYYKAGDVEVEIPSQPKRRRRSFKGGDYVDYEEIE